MAIAGAPPAVPPDAVTYTDTAGRLPDGTVIRMKFVNGQPVGLVDGGGAQIDSQGRPVSTAPPTYNGNGEIVAKDAADAYALHLQYNVPLSSVAYPQADGTVRPPTTQEATAASNTANGPLGNGGIFGMGTPGDALTTLAGAMGVGGAPVNVNTAGINSAVDSSKALADQYNGQYNSYSPISAPVAQDPQAIQAAIAQQQAAIQAGTATAGQASAAQIGSTALAQQQQAIQAQQVQAAIAQQQAAIQAQQVQAAQAGRTVLGPTALAGNTQIAPVDQASMTKLAPTALSQAAQIAADQQAQFRTDQRGLVTGLQGAISGQDPSVAAIMLRQATERNSANQYAMAQAANGQNVGLAQRQAMINAADINQQAIGQQALLRAQEIATARGQLGGVLDSGRQGDLSLATNQAGLQQQVALANQSATNTGSITQLGADVQTKLANAGFVNTQNMTQAQLNQAVQLANAGFKNTATTTQAQLDAAQVALNVQQQNSVGTANADRSLSANTTNATLAQQVALANQASQNQVGIANQGANLQAGITNSTLAQQVALANASAQNSTNQQNATFQNAANLQNAAGQTQTSIANANNTTSANTASSQLANAVQLANANNQTQANLTTGQLQTQTDIANAGNATTTAGQNITAQNDLAQNALTAQGQTVTGTIGAAQAQATAAAAAAQAEAAKVGGLAAAGATILTKSDRRAKTDIHNSEAEIAEFMGGIRPYAFKYKEPDSAGAAPGQRYGVMAQDLERSKVGRTLVRDTPTGKMVDAGQAAMAALAALSAINKRVSGLEKR